MAIGGNVRTLRLLYGKGRSTGREVPRLACCRTNPYLPTYGKQVAMLTDDKVHRMRGVELVSNLRYWLPARKSNDGGPKTLITAGL